MDNENVKECAKAMLEQYLDITTKKNVCDNPPYKITQTVKTD